MAQATLTFSAPTNYAVPDPSPSAHGLQDVAVGDFNKDGDPDLATVDEDQDKVSILLGSTGGTFTGPTHYSLYSHANPLSIATGDFNGDGDLDLATANEGSSTDPQTTEGGASVLLGGAGGTFGSPAHYETGPIGTSDTIGIRPQAIAVGDFNADSDPDLAIATLGTSTGDLAVLLGGSGGTFGSRANYGAGVNPRGVGVGDFDGDSDRDIAVANAESNNVSVFLGNGAGSFGAATNFSGGINPHVLEVGDFNGDSDPDLVVANETAHAVSILVGGSAGSFGSPASYGTNSLPDAIAIGEFSGDSDPDLAVATQGHVFGVDKITVLVGQAGATFGGRQDFDVGQDPAVGEDPTGVAVGNFNADAYHDLAVTTGISSVVSILLAGPETMIDSGPTGATNNSTPTFTFSSNDPGATFQCRVGGGSFTSCVSPHTTSTLADGARTFEVRAVDAAGRTDPTPAARSFTVDTTPPQTTIDSGPSGATNNTTPSFSFSSSEAGSTFECRVDMAAFAPCSSPHTIAPPGDGGHTFEVRASDQVGNTDPTGATRSFTVDTVPPPAPTLTATVPASPSTDNSPSVRGAAEPGSTVRLYANSSCAGTTAATGTAASFASPGLTVSVPENSVSTFHATATDQLGNVSACSSSAITYIEDSTPPETTIDSGPSGPTNDTTPTFGFSSSDPVSTFECRVDAGAFSACGSPHTTTSLSAGPHTFDVRAKDGAGNTDASAARRSFMIDLTPPTPPTITGIEPASPADDNHPRVKGTAEADTTIRLHATTCSASLNGTAPAADFASIGVQGSVPDNSTTTFYASAVDRAGNISACSSSFVNYVEVSAPPSDPIPASPGAGAIITDTTGPLMSVAGKVVKMDSRGAVSAALSCPASEPGGCEGSLSLETLRKVRASGAARRVKLGSARFKVAGGQSTRVKVRLSRKNKRLVTSLRRVRVVALVTAQDAAGNRATARRTLTLKAARA